MNPSPAFSPSKTSSESPLGLRPSLRWWRDVPTSFLQLTLPPTLLTESSAASSGARLPCPYLQALSPPTSLGCCCFLSLSLGYYSHPCAHCNFQDLCLWPGLSTAFTTACKTSPHHHIWKPAGTSNPYLAQSLTLLMPLNSSSFQALVTLSS